MKKYSTWLKLAVALILCVWLVQTNTLDFRLLASLRPDSWILLLAATCLLASIIISAVRWAILMRIAGILMKPVTVLRLQLIGALFCTILPGAAGGDAVRGVYLFRILPTHRTTALLVLAVDRVFSLLGLVVLTGILLWDNAATPIIYTRIIQAVIAISIVGIIALTLCASYLKTSMPQLRWLERFRPQFLQIREAVLLYQRRWPAMLACLALSMLSSFAAILGIVVLSGAFDFLLPWKVTALASALGNLSALIPLTPGGIGLSETVFAKLCSDLTGIMAPYATLYLSSRIVMACVTLSGVFAYIRFDPARNAATTRLQP